MGTQTSHSISAGDKNIRRNTLVLLRLTALSSLFALSGCMMTASFENDFSSMEENPISDLVKKTIPLEASMRLKHLVDEEKFTETANTLFIGKHESNLSGIFTGNGDNCDYLYHETLKMEAVKCQAQRWWNVNNDGYPYFGLIKDVNKYIYPGVKLIFVFSLDNNKNIYQYKVDISDVTIRKDMY